MEACVPAVRWRRRGAVEDSWRLCQSPDDMRMKSDTHNEGECLGSTVGPSKHHVPSSLETGENFADDVLLVPVTLQFVSKQIWS